MTTNQLFKGTVLVLMIVPLLMLIGKSYAGYFSTKQLLPQTAYKIQYDFQLAAKKQAKNLFVKTYIPQSNQHQTIAAFSIQSDDFDSQITENAAGKKIIWNKENPNSENYNIQCSFDYKGNSLQYQIDENLPLIQEVSPDLASYLEPSEHIQSDDALIIRKANNLAKGTEDLSTVLKNIYASVRLISSIETSELTDALTTLKTRSASCNGKSRLFVAYCRALGIPARVVGGIILNESKKRTSHLWAEAYVQGQWIPFDALNGHFAYLPHNYMELYKGDYFLLARTANIDFDYNYTIQKETVLADGIQSAYTLWSLPLKAGIPLDVLKLILLLPICSLIVALLKNIVGIKTFGVFLPAIMAMAMDGIGFVYGTIAFLVVVAVVSVLHYPLNKWGLLYTPKLVALIIGVVGVLLGLTYIGVQFNSIQLSSMVFFPIIVLTIAAERFARTIAEDGLQAAIKLQFQTLLVTLLCYVIYSTDFLVGFFLTFPETYFMIAGVVLLIGQWIGLRIMEYRRFEQILA